MVHNTLNHCLKVKSFYGKGVTILIGALNSQVDGFVGCRWR